jgi:hypothetical protein
MSAMIDLLMRKQAEASSTAGQKPLDQLSNDELATLFGKPGYTPGYNSNDAGSWERAWNSYLQRLTPDQLIKRYQSADPNQIASAQDKAGYQAYQAFKNLFGRDPNTAEYSQILPAFQGPNGQLNGNAFLANLQQQYKANPTLDPNSQINTQKPGDIQGQVSQQFKAILGRAPTQDELAHFTQAIQTNQTDAYGLGNFLKQMPEYTNAQDTQFRQGLNTELQNYDVQEFNREKTGLMADYMSRGMNPGTSPSLDYALTDLMGRIAQNRSQYLAGLSAQQYGGNKDLAIGNYQNTLDQMYNQNQQQRQNTMAYGKQLLDQGYQGADYQTQMKDFQNFMSNNRGGSYNPMYGAIGGLVGAGLGSFGGPMGASAGYQIGSGLGNSYGYLNR